MISYSLCAQSWTGFSNQPTEYFTDDCLSDAEVCIQGIAPNQTNQYLIELDGTVYSSPTGACDFDQIGVYNLANFMQLAPAGPYSLNGWLVNGNNISGSFNNFQQLVALMQSADPSGNWQLEFPLIVGGNSNTTYDTLFLQSNVFNVVATLGYSVGYLPTGISVSVEPGTHTLAVTHIPTGFSDTLLFTVSCPLTLTQVITTTVGQSGSFCPVLSDLQSLPVTAQNICLASGESVAFSEIDILGCLTYEAVAPGNDTACIVLCDDQGFCDTTYLVVQVGLPPVGQAFYLTPQVQVGAQITVCPPEWANTLVLPFCSDTSSSPVATIALSIAGDCLNINGIAPGVSDTFCFTSCAAGLPCDTTYVIVTVTPPPPALVFYVYDTIYLSTPSGETYCFIDPTVGLLAHCAQTGQSVSFSSVGACINYSPLATGVDTMCYLACSEQTCDTLYFYITVLLKTSPDTAALVIGTGESTVFCASLSEINTAGSAFVVGSADNSITETTTPIGCFNVIGQSVGTDTLILVITGTNGLTDTTLLFVFVVSDPTSSFVYDTIPVSGQGSFCLSLDELSGPVVVVDQPCLSNGSASYQINQDTWCVTYNGLQLGIDSVCYVLCDNQSNCDTTYLVILVADIVIAPTAYDDVIQSVQDSVIFVQVITNDINLTSGSTVTVLSGPQSGTLLQISGGVFTYAPNYGFCGVDLFTYSVCNGLLCDTAQVTITIPCIDTLIVYNGFSPNNDGKNDTWVITGISRIPNHQVLVFNRWGNLVFQSNRYENNWDGTFQGQLLPDGTYFYLIVNNDNQKVRSGYLQILR